MGTRQPRATTSVDSSPPKSKSRKKVQQVGAVEAEVLEEKDSASSVTRSVPEKELTTETVRREVQHGTLSVSRALFSHARHENNRLDFLRAARDQMEARLYSPERLAALPIEHVMEAYEILNARMMESVEFQSTMHSMVVDTATMDRLFQLLETFKMSPLDGSGPPSGSAKPSYNPLGEMSPGVAKLLTNTLGRIIQERGANTTAKVVDTVLAPLETAAESS